jgi:hypothetical protein
MSSLHWLVVVRHAEKLQAKYGTMRAAKYLAANGVAVQVAIMLLA